MLRYNISMNLCNDYSNMVLNWMKYLGKSSKKTGWDIVYEYFNLNKKVLLPHKRNVFFSKEFVCPDEVQTGLELLINKFRNGEDVTSHLSKAALNPSKPDELLYDWGIYHFHLGQERDAKSNFIQRSGPILFARVDDENVYCINVYPHGVNVLPPWCRQEMIKIVHNNWPETVNQYRIEGVSLLYPQGEPPTDREYAMLRKSHVTTMLEVEKNIVYAPLGGGMALSGHSMEITRQCNHIWNTLKQNELYIQKNVSFFIKKIKDEIGDFPIGEKRYFKLWCKNERFCVVDLASLVAFHEIRF